MINGTLKQINKELKRVQEIKNNLTDPKRKHRVSCYKRIHRMENALKKAADQLSHFSKMSHLV